MNTEKSVSAIDHTVPARVKRSKAALPIKYRLEILSRFMMALLGGYGVSSLLAIDISFGFSAHPVNAALAGTMLAFIFHVIVFIYVFSTASFVKSHLGVLLAFALLLIIYYGLGGKF